MTAEFPPQSPSAVFVAHGRARVSAPASTVHALLTDLSTWGDWNPFIPRVDVLSRPPGSTTTSDSGTRLEAGMRVTMHTYIRKPWIFGGGHAHVEGVDKITYVSNPPPPSAPLGTIYRLVWRADGFKDWFMHAEHVHEIEVLGDRECEYRHYEPFSGLWAWPTWLVVGAALQEGFDLYTDGLCMEAERRARAGDAGKDVK